MECFCNAGVGHQVDEEVAERFLRTTSNRRVFDGQANYLRWKNVRHKAHLSHADWWSESVSVFHFSSCLAEFLKLTAIFLNQLERTNQIGIG